MNYYKLATIAVVLFALSFGVNAAIPPGYLGVPFCCDTLKRHYQQIPGQVACVFFDSGGEGVAFHYPGGCGSGGATMRKNAAGQTIAADAVVCMQQYNGNDHIFGSNPCQAETGYWHLAWITPASPTDPGEWLKYSVHVNTAGMYYVSFHEGTGFIPNLQLLTFYDGQNVKTDSISNMLVDTPSCIEPWHAWATTLVDSVVLDTGLQVIQLSFKVGSWNLDLINFVLHYPSPIVQTSLIHVTVPDAMKVNPVENSLNISFSLAQAGRTSFSIVDCKGRLVRNPVTKFLMSGTQSQSLPRGKLSPGVYFMQMEHNGIVSESRFLITW